MKCSSLALLLGLASLSSATTSVSRPPFGLKIRLYSQHDPCPLVVQSPMGMNYACMSIFGPSDVWTLEKSGVETFKIYN